MAPLPGPALVTKNVMPFAFGCGDRMPAQPARTMDPTAASNAKPELPMAPYDKR